MRHDVPLTDAVDGVRRGRIDPVAHVEQLEGRTERVEPEIESLVPEETGGGVSEDGFRPILTRTGSDLPAGETDAELPLGVQCSAPFGADEDVLAWSRELADVLG